MERHYSSCAVFQLEAELYPIDHHPIPSSSPGISDLKRDHGDIPNDAK